MNNLLLNPIFIAITTGVILGLFSILYLFVRKTVSQPHKLDKFEELYRKINEDIKYAVSPKFVKLSLGVNDLVDLAVEIWRMEQRIAKSTSTLSENHKKGLDNSIQKLRRYLEKYDIKIVDYTNQKFNEGLNLEILSVEKDPSVEVSVVKETIEPTIIYKGQVVRKAKIILIKNN